MNAITIFGDSITFGSGDNVDRGWCGRLKKYFESKGGHHYLYNLGVCGDTTKDLLERFDVEAKARVKFRRELDKNTIIFSIGINDSKLLAKSKIPEIEIDVFKENIKTLAGKAKFYTKKITFIGLTPVDEKITSDYEEATFTNERICEFNNSIKEFCQKNDIPFLDMFKEFSKLDFKKILIDGLHPSPKGYEEMYKIIKDFLTNKKLID